MRYSIDFSWFITPIGVGSLSYIYNLPVMRYLIKMTDIVVNEVPKLTNDPELLKTCREVGEGVWQYLQ